MLSILHISDLHRSMEDPLSNEEIVEALISDRLRYSKGDPPIASPNAVVISGDVIQGVTLSHKDPAAEIARQYEAAEDLLARLANEFLGGDRSRLIIAPGNHDVNWPLSRQSMEIATDDDKVKPADAFGVASRFRWSWADKAFYKITDNGAYERRFDAYWDFVERFYNGIANVPIISRDKQFSVFSLEGGKVGIAVFNSCFHNDCFAFHGAIQPSAIAAASRYMRDEHNFGLWIAVWHHSVQGAPYRTDYMDIDQVHDMIGRGFRLGLHGHQHKHQVLPLSVHLPDEEKMAVVSAGSLCAGPRELPTGSYRQYNVIEIDEGLQKARVHVRHMETAHLFSPRHMTQAGGKAYVDVSWSPPLYLPSEPRGHAQDLLKSEQLLMSGDTAGAIKALGEFFPDAPAYARTLYVQAAIRGAAWDDIIVKLGVPTSQQELMAVVTAFDKLRRPEEGLQVLAKYADALEVPAAQRRDLEMRLQVRARSTK